ncbi:Histone-lysine N-methyltransferase SETMAR [Eumeta japonica]|uniref:Histone-lysine N-methyltransferase SETMAR n=1 Tax=Eumeta variegata TaxID=151549 RepID=A0A4C1T1F9_EUMVA|nr:Histone-lysine N-methyltransferase SETMAR [Eumeta japonica]
MMSVRVAQNWFNRFHTGIFDIKDELRSGRPVTDKVDAISEEVKQHQHIRSYDISEELGIDHKTVLAHLKTAGYTKA